MKIDDISVKLTADTEQFAEDMNVATDAVDMYADAVNRVVPNITLRGCTNIYMTINNFNETEKEWSGAVHTISRPKGTSDGNSKI